ncbi:MAG: hypothetical protein K1X72_23270 [Pyrinomonadaceae bacterium]|nr:hypothetical protein [Pyrinomonadaceae bacterium]
MKNTERQKTNVLLTLPIDLDRKLKREAETQQRKRHAQIIFILENFFANKPTEKEKSK